MVFTSDYSCLIRYRLSWRSLITEMITFGMSYTSRSNIAKASAGSPNFEFRLYQEPQPFNIYVLEEFRCSFLDCHSERIADSRCISNEAQSSRIWKMFSRPLG